MKQLFVLFSFFFGFVPVFGQIHENIMIGNQGFPNETSIYIDKTNTNRMVAGANINKFYYSSDAGHSWTQGELVSNQNGVWGDPCIFSDTEGNFYFIHLSYPPSGDWIDRIVCQKSTDGGMTWNDGSYMGLNPPKQQDKAWADVDWANNNIYCTWTQFDSYGSSSSFDKSNILFSKSTDGGETWSPAIQINEVPGDCVDSDNTVEGAVPAVGPGGEIYVAWAGPEGLVFDKSLDGGETWLDNDIFVADIPGGWDYDIPGISRSNGLPVTVCDHSGGDYNGNIYINWSDQRNGADDTDVWFVKSTDGGETWSEPVRVNDDSPGKQQFFTWMTIDQVTGYLWFVWYDRRNYADTQTDVYMAVSTDGGGTFINFKVSEQAFVPQSSYFFGDYTNVSAHDNVVRPIWTRLNNGDMSVWTAIVNVDDVISGAENFAAIPYAKLLTNYPNPFALNTKMRYKVYKNSKLSLKVYNVFGEVVATIFENKQVSPGEYVKDFNAGQYGLSSGAYYFSLRGENLNLKQKMLIVR